MSLFKNGRAAALLAGLFSATALIATAPSAAQASTHAAASTSATVTLVHGVRGLLADVVVDGKTALKGFAYERASSPMALPPGSHRVQVYKAGVPHTDALLDVALTVKAGQVLTAAVGFDSSGAPKAYVFDDRLSAAARSASSIVVRNVSQGSAPQVILDGRAASGTVAAGGQRLWSVSPGSHTVGLKVNGSWLLTNQPVRASSGRAMVVYIVGLQSAKSIALVADSVTPTTSASAVNSGGLPPVADPPLLPTWASLGAVALGLGALMLLMARRQPAYVRGGRAPHAA